MPRLFISCAIPRWPSRFTMGIIFTIAAFAGPEFVAGVAKGKALVHVLPDAVHHSSPPGSTVILQGADGHRRNRAGLQGDLRQWCA